MDQRGGYATVAQVVPSIDVLTDTHCHVDQFDSPESLVRECSGKGIAVVAVTNLPAHYEIARQHLAGIPNIYPALGLHPLTVAKHEAEVERFLWLAPNADYIGEVGLDFSFEGRGSKHLQIEVFNRLLSCLVDRPRFITVHSRRAEKETLECLIKAGLHKAVFHWYSGSLKGAEAILAAGHYFSINPGMIAARSFPSLIKLLPRNRILLESDGPHVIMQSRPARPTDIVRVCETLAQYWSVSADEAARQLEVNLRGILHNITLKS